MFKSLILFRNQHTLHLYHLFIFYYYYRPWIFAKTMFDWIFKMPPYKCEICDERSILWNIWRMLMCLLDRVYTPHLEIHLTFRVTLVLPTISNWDNQCSLLMSNQSKGRSLWRGLWWRRIPPIRFVWKQKRTMKNQHQKQKNILCRILEQEREGLVAKQFKVKG